MMIYGIIGFIFIVIGWIPQIMDMIKNKKSNLNLLFSVLYILGSFLLILHSIYLKDIIFVFLNSFAFIMGIIGLFYSLKYKKTNKRKLIN